MKRFALFAGPNYYPSGGWDDFKQSFDTIEEAVAEGQRTFVKYGHTVVMYDWFHVVDLTTGEQVMA